MARKFSRAGSSVASAPQPGRFMRLNVLALCAACAILVMGPAWAQSAPAGGAINQASQTAAPGASSAATGGGQGGKSSGAAATAPQGGVGQPVLGAVLVLLPVQMAMDDKLANGCWVRFYDGKDYRGPNLTLVGPVDMPKMDVPGNTWLEWDSVIVGPKARVSTFDNENYRQRTAQLASGERVPDLDKKLGWFQEIHSTRVTCAA